MVQASEREVGVAKRQAGGLRPHLLQAWQRETRRVRQLPTTTLAKEGERGVLRAEVKRQIHRQNSMS